MFHGMPIEQKRMALDQLAQAQFHHEQWCEALNTTLVCSQVPDSRDLDPDAHHNCRFGQWLYGAGAKLFERYPAFAQIEASHKRMHDRAREALAAASSPTRLSVETYELFTTALKQMRLEVATTRRELDESISNVDPLTGVGSRTGMLMRLREQHGMAQRKVQVSCIAMIDIDHFKQVNDRYGHLVGDATLVEFARRLTAGVRPYDMLFRFGGEEFLLCAPGVTLKEGFDMMERLRADVAATSIICNDAPPLRITASFGVATLDPDAPVEQSIERADQALYQAKSSGRNCTRIWEGVFA